MFDIAFNNVNWQCKKAYVSVYIALHNHAAPSLDWVDLYYPRR
jgi:hypothetical protein